jgi:hypothetical protein
MSAFLQSPGTLPPDEPLLPHPEPAQPAASGASAIGPLGLSIALAVSLLDERDVVD